MATSTLKSNDDDPIFRRLVRARTLLSSSSIYLADGLNNIVDRAEWKRVGPVNSFLTKDSVLADRMRSQEDL